ncbi:hypothetical protein DFH09DRAFT_1331342 [Mycena vulgaris]|nr:hypothetical protein DFH09DRAFT_1331342 [Mycena vulgaris]
MAYATWDSGEDAGERGVEEECKGAASLAGERELDFMLTPFSSIPCATEAARPIDVTHDRKSHLPRRSTLNNSTHIHDNHGPETCNFNVSITAMCDIAAATQARPRIPPPSLIILQEAIARLRYRRADLRQLALTASRRRRTRGAAWLGTFTPAHHTGVLSYYTKMAVAMDSDYNLDCTCTNGDTNVHIYADEFGTFYRCGA